MSLRALTLHPTPQLQLSVPAGLGCSRQTGLPVLPTPISSVLPTDTSKSSVLPTNEVPSTLPTDEAPSVLPTNSSSKLPGTDAAPALASHTSSSSPMLLAPDLSLVPPSGAQYNDTVPFTIIDKDAPNYVVDTLEFFALIEDGGATFWDLVEQWQVFELRMGYPSNSQKRDDRLPTEGHLEAIAHWMKVHRSYKKLPEFTPATLGPAWKQWWMSMQPQCCLNRSSWPPVHVEPKDRADWNKLWKAGPNGLFLALISILWWLWAVIENDEPMECYDWLSSKIREEAYETSKGVDEHLCSESGAGLDSQAGDKMY
uniref:Oligopeptide transporter OPT-like protein n=1 Tax=Ganoderma boninense TaxID=34458 RepID=A0A5K1K029_9APHY|nr:Oligopeptide transporter OPT-like protein [Ganoderma boninense]